MAKRNADELHSERGLTCAKQPRIDSECATVVASLISEDAAFNEAIHVAELVLQRSVYTQKLQHTLDWTGYEQRMRVIGAQLQADVARPESLIDLSRTMEGDKVRAHIVSVLAMHKAWDALSSFIEPDIQLILSFL